MPIVENRLITSTDWSPGLEPKDGIDMSNGMQWDIKNCIIDLSNAPYESVDEACGITRGSSAKFENCVIRGAGKNILCGCGDEEWVDKERGKAVTFYNCVIENFCRRGPEVQDHMKVVLHDCMVYNWGYNLKFDTRAFGAWAHDGGRIEAKGTLFLRGDRPTLKHWFLDHVNHFGQCVNERGLLRALFYRDAWLSGYKRALTAGPGGYVFATNCYFDKGLVTDSNENPMSSHDAYERLKEFTNLKDKLSAELGWQYP